MSFGHAAFFGLGAYTSSLLESKISYYYVVFIMMVLITLFTRRLSQSKMGSCFRAIRENETAAGALGIDVFGYKMRAMAISAFFTGMGGTFFAQY